MICGKFTTMGHGDNAVCGKLYWEDIYICDQCKLDSLKKQRDELLAALKEIMLNDCPLIGSPTNQELIDHWEHEKSQGRGDADIHLAALYAIAKAEQP
jgi:hypothetical protein